DRRPAPAGARGGDRHGARRSGEPAVPIDGTRCERRQRGDAVPDCRLDVRSQTTMPGSVRLRRDLGDIVRAGIAGVDPGRLVLRALERLEGNQPIRLLSAGKGAGAMAAAAARALGSRIVDGLVVSPESVDVAPPLAAIA